MSDVALRARQRPDGGFALLEGGDGEVEATAWAALALATPPTADRAAARRAAALLERLQREDGRLSIAPPHPGNTWPTAVAVLAWGALDLAPERRQRALDFLERQSGDHWARPADWPLGHDPELVGWPWVEGTSAWVEPTALALLALTAGGRGGGERARAGRRLLLDRQIPSGGWNYGNPSAFDRELLPSPESTGLALAALAGEIPRAAVAASLDYLLAELPRLTTPLALAWTGLALAAWDERPADLDRRLAACAIADPAPAGPYDTIELALLRLAHEAPRGLLAAVRSGGRG
jgi:hypothetical protein